MGILPGIQWGRLPCLGSHGKILATGGTDTTVLLWDWRHLAGLTREGTTPIADKEIESAWANLASPDARKGYRAIGTLAASGDRTVTLLRERLRPAAAGDWDRVRKSGLPTSTRTTLPSASRRAGNWLNWVPRLSFPARGVCRQYAFGSTPPPRTISWPARR